MVIEERGRGDAREGGGIGFAIPLRREREGRERGERCSILYQVAAKISRFIVA